MFKHVGAVAAAIAFVLGGGAAAGAQEQPESQEDSGVTVGVEVKVEPDGLLSVVETVTVPSGQEATRHAPLRLLVGEDTERVFSVRDVTTDGAGAAEVAGDEFVIRAPEGKTTVQYTVDGAVAELRDQQEIRWRLAGGWDTELAEVTGSFAAPVPEASSIRCLAGGSGRQCESAETADGGVIKIEQSGLEAGDPVDLAVGLPSATVPANARFADTATLANAFVLTTTAVFGFTLAGLGILLWCGFLFWSRRRDASVPDAPAEPAKILVHENDRVFFASPDGVLPGQVGTIVDGKADVVDVTATVVDLAVRNYLLIAPVRDADGITDWRISRRNDPDESLHPYERAVFQAVLPSGADTSLLSELRTGRGIDLKPFDEAMYTDVVARGWFSRSPGPGRGFAGLAGVVLALLGFLLTVVLALSEGDALLGLALIVFGLAISAGAGLLPRRTARGRAVAGQIRGLIGYLQSVPADEIPDADRELVFSRSLPYAVVLGETERWLNTFADLDPEADGAAGLYWFGGLEGERDLKRLGTHLPALLTALDGVLAEAGHLRSLR
ncbi:DUF2207 domain-containing protein [Amycolatopsis magusensis]|uniref:Membrane protein DUF2207 n=1 Tax=Amycolatopsis magusensis TaxID=882444 RepID=A0ABS4PNA1_9PSEU|nr:DUF2207 domain-containing protein [Amycolatopsis magusensis]MBP2180872.1 hypothetical protein [Amycolatopsis magusensis]